MRLRRTVAALPPPDESLHSAFRRGQHVKSGTRANAHCVEWGGFAAGWGGSWLMLMLMLFLALLAFLSLLLVLVLV